METVEQGDRAPRFVNRFGISVDGNSVPTVMLGCQVQPFAVDGQESSPSQLHVLGRFAMAPATALELAALLLHLLGHSQVKDAPAEAAP